jgi:tetratricopeptide (TPR) repeat protein
LVFVLLSIPASVISLGIEDDFGKALNPAHLAGIMRQIGWPYLVLCIFLLLLSSASAVAEEYVFPHMPVWLAAILGTFLTGYFTLSMFHLMGYVVYQYHEPLGYDEVKEFSNNLPASKGPHAEAHPLLNQVNILIAEGKTEEAKQRLASELASSNDPALHDRYHKLLVALNDQEGLRSHGQSYIPVLISINKLGKAVEVLTACQKSNPKFALTDASTTYSLAKYAADMQRHDTALKTLSGFAQRFAGSPHIPAAYLLAAQIVCEQKNDFAQAKKILTSLLKSYPQHALAGEIRNYLQFVERLEKPTATSSH